MLKEHKNQDYFAVDLEHHSEYSFRGFTCLIQISHLKKDYIIDALALHDYMYLLRGVFANPSIRKVFHSAYSDVEWLQKDFHIYVVNMFDTQVADEVMRSADNRKPKIIKRVDRRKLKDLVHEYCPGVKIDKLLQNSDWRKRPLTSDMIHYARCDTRYLFYLAYQLAKKLKNNGCLSEAVKRSNNITLKLYQKKDIAVVIAASRILQGQQSKGLTFPNNSYKFEKFLLQLCIIRDAIARGEDVSLEEVFRKEDLAALAWDQMRYATCLAPASLLNLKNEYMNLLTRLALIKMRSSI